MSRLIHLLTAPLTSDRLDRGVVLGVCLAAALALLLVAWQRMAQLPLTPAEALLGILGSLSVALQIVLIGLVVHLAPRQVRDAKGSVNDPR
ncbi:MAG: hypothetical protein U0736_06605 [Gemmataceae bacterium]